MPNIRKKIRNIICFLSDRRFFWSIMLVYVFIKLLPVIAFDKRFTYLVVFLSFFILILRIIKIIIYDKEIKINKYRFITILFILLCLLSAFYNIGFNLSNLYIKNPEYRVLIVLIINLFIVFSFDTNNNYKNDIKYLDIISMIIVVFSFFNILFSIYDAIINKRDRIWGLTGSVWSFTHFVAISFAINLYLLIKEKKYLLRLFYFINLFLHLITLIFTQQRAGYLCIIIGFLLLLLLLVLVGRINEFKNCLIKNNKMVVLVIVILIFFMILISHYINLKIIAAKVLNLSSSGRIDIIKISLKNLLDNKAFLFGLIGNLHKIDVNVESQKLQILTSEGSFHNIYICILIFFGIIAFVVFILFIIIIIKKLILLVEKSKTDEDIFDLLILSCFGVIGSLVSAFFDDNMIINLPYLSNLMFFILCSIISSIDEKRIDNVK